MADEGPWLTDDEQRAWRKLAAVSLLLPTALDAPLQRDSGLTHFEYLVLAMLSEAPDRSLRMSLLAGQCSASLSRLSHVVNRLERRGRVRRTSDPDDARATVAQLTDDGFAALVDAAPGHVRSVRELIFDWLTPEQVTQLEAIGGQILRGLDPDRRMAATPRE